MSPTQRSLKKLRAEGWFCAIVEHFNPHVKIRQDLFGMFDILAIRGDETLGVQTTSGSNISARLKKLESHPNLVRWISHSRRAVVHGWSKRGARGKRKLWECSELYPHVKLETML